MCSSIREFGFKIPILPRSSGEVVDGHLRLKAAQKLGLTELPVILCDEWTPEQVKAFRLMVNRSVGWAEWDEELLTLEIKELHATDYDLALTGFDAASPNAEPTQNTAQCIAARVQNSNPRMIPAG
jgi:ParB-like chromosome segregation protein Spo0J